MRKPNVMRAKLSLIALTAVVVAVLCSQPFAPGASAQSETPDGAKIYENTCARCHNAPEPTQRSPQSWQTIMLHMRVRGGLTASETAKVMAFLKLETSPPLPARGEESMGAKALSPVAAGKKLFEDLNCLACHSIGGKGGQVGPSLDEVGLRRTRGEMLARMRARRAGDIMPTLPPQLSDEQLDQLVEYLLSLKGEPGKTPKGRR